MTAMEMELDRSMKALGSADPKAYFVSYTMTDQQRVEVQGSNGALLDSHENRGRYLQVQVRVGDYKEDSTRNVGGRDRSFAGAVPVTMEDDVPVLRRAIWLQTDRHYREGAEALLQIKTGRDVKVQSQESGAPDFSQEPPQVHSEPPASFKVDRAPWEARVRKYTEIFRGSPAVLNSIATFSALAETEYQVTSEGTRLQFGHVHFRLELFLQAKAEDGMNIERYANFDWTDKSPPPDEKTVLAQVQQLIKEAGALRTAPLVEPYAGPAMLTGRAAAVFFHEVFGHRAEGHRQKDINEGQTFARKVNQRVMPEFISIISDPTLPKQAGVELLGFYPFDDEGVKAQRVVLVEKGILKGFLMSRAPLVEFPHSNGHGRRQIGLAPVSRQSNLIIMNDDPRKRVSFVQLKKMLVEEVKKQGKPFGLLIDDIAGGFTFTGRGLPQAFQVLPLVVYKVYPDGRPDELVRGVDIVGTPLLSLEKIVATGDTPEVFNGYCGAESGSVPVSAVAPPILVTEMEVQKKETSTDKPPILPHPNHDPQAKGGRP
jgi:predicted Zn-dependent protease